MTARACTDWLVESCHPAPDNADSIRGAKAPSPAITSNHSSRTARRCVADQRPNRANPPSRTRVGAVRGTSVVIRLMTNLLDESLARTPACKTDSLMVYTFG